MRPVHKLGPGRVSAALVEPFEQPRFQLDSGSDISARSAILAVGRSSAVTVMMLYAVPRDRRSAVSNLHFLPCGSMA